LQISKRDAERKVNLPEGNTSIVKLLALHVEKKSGFSLKIPPDVKP
jgi:hypothetical protein